MNIDRRQVLQGVASSAVLPWVTDHDTPTCPICNDPCIGEVSSKAAQEWGVEHKMSVACFQSDEGNLWIHDPEEKK